jgi:hypothetical protein
VKWLLLFTAVGLVALGAATTAEVSWTLISGWVPYLYRVLPKVTIEWRAVAVGVAAVVLFTAGVHWLGRTAFRRWRPTWSLATVGAVVVAFAAGICLIGVVHQTGWLLAADEPANVEVEKFKGSGRGNSGSNLKQVVLGIYNLHDAYQGHFPAMSAPDGTVLHSWVTPALVYMGYSQSGIDLTGAWNSPQNRQHFRAPLDLLVNPALRTAPIRDADGYGLAHYAANCRAMANGNFRPLKEFTDGTANTLLIGEVNANFRRWGDPANCRDPARGINTSPHGFGGPPGSGGALFAIADGSVQFISDRISPAVLKALATPNGGEPVDGGP